MIVVLDSVPDLDSRILYTGAQFLGILEWIETFPVSQTHPRRQRVLLRSCGMAIFKLRARTSLPTHGSVAFMAKPTSSCERSVF